MTAAGPAAEAAPAGLPGAVRWLLLPLFCLLLLASFSLALFPYERFREPAARRLAAATGARVEIASLSGGLGVAGPHVEARGVALRWPDGASLALERARLRPAWSLSWLRGSPALRVSAEGLPGEAEGTLWPGPPRRVEGELRSLELGRLPLGPLSGALSLEGRLDAELALARGRRGLRGRVRFRAREGSFATPELPVAIPFEALRGELERGEDGAVEVSSLELEGPMLSLTAQGRVGAAPRAAVAPLDLSVRIERVDPQLVPALRPYGVRGEAGGELAVEGTLSRPRVRPR